MTHSSFTFHEFHFYKTQHFGLRGIASHVRKEYAFIYARPKPKLNKEKGGLSNNALRSDFKGCLDYLFQIKIIGSLEYFEWIKYIYTYI